ncbi:hypothetical protein [Azospirillum halopraeferens]|uniref:hypothetical protein n=1 Tax=Azospirillum halopraeferens TaxID=34010 RepID=UPI000418226D|nr:hypothetical protein [Azospirillum halopraeferens]
MTGTTYHYRLFGWRLRSPRALPLLHPAPPEEPAADAAGPDIEVRFGPVRAPEAPAVPEDMRITVRADGAMTLTRAEGIRLLVEDGRWMTVDAAADVTDAELHTALFGAGLAMLCHQRGRPPLHAAVLEIGGRGVALAGHCGAGKSTTTRALVERGHRLLSDDLAVIDPDSALAHPGFPSVKLWGTSAAAFGDAADPALRVLRHLDKFHHPLAAFRAEPVPLAMVLVLKADNGLGSPVIDTLTRAEAAAALHRHVSWPAASKALDKGATAFRRAARLAGRVPVRVLRRPDGLDRLDALCDAIEEAVRVADGKDRG